MPNAMEQPIPPSVREILTAYAAKCNEVDREVLLAILQAKAAEDQRITALATLNQQYVALQRHALEATALAMRQHQQQEGDQTNGHHSSSPSRPQSQPQHRPDDDNDRASPSRQPPHSQRGATGHTPHHRPLAHLPPQGLLLIRFQGPAVESIHQLTGA